MQDTTSRALIFISILFLLNTETSGAINSPRVINRQNHIVRRRQTFSNPCLTGIVGGTNRTSQNNMANFHNSVGNVPGNMIDSSSQLMSWTGPSAQNSVTLDTADGANFNGIIYDGNGTQTAATEQQKAQLTQYKAIWTQWFNQEMARQFPEGFPFNMPRTLPQATPEPQAPCFCAQC
ncbi:hypothetical protein Ddc_16109 [Ditylenchus destructor]|nr:hypothetical protein Ddc_16109 [Ditylenchus destructor]